MNFTIVNVDKTRSISTIIGNFCFVILFALIFYDFHYRSIIIFLLLIIIFITILFGRKKVNLLKTGEIKSEGSFLYIFDINNIIINEFSFNEINKIKLKYTAFKGELAVNSSIRNFIPSEGYDNVIEIHLKDGIYKYNLYLENQADAIRFKMLHRFLKDNNINIMAKGL